MLVVSFFAQFRFVKCEFRYSTSRIAIDLHKKLSLVRSSHMLQILNRTHARAALKPHARVFAGGRNGRDVQTLHKTRFSFRTRVTRDRTAPCLPARSGHSVKIVRFLLLYRVLCSSFVHTITPASDPLMLISTDVILDYYDIL